MTEAEADKQIQRMKARSQSGTGGPPRLQEQAVQEALAQVGQEAPGGGRGRGPGERGGGPAGATGGNSK